MVRKLAAIVVLGLLAASCHTITEELPTTTTGQPVQQGPIGLENRLN